MPNLPPFLVVGLGGFLGAVARFGVYSLVHDEQGLPRFPAATLIVNVTGCFLIGLLFGWMTRGEPVSRELRLFLAVGLLGSFTTFSTFGHETVVLLRAADYRGAALSVVCNLALGLVAVGLGNASARAITVS